MRCEQITRVITCREANHFVAKYLVTTTIGSPIVVVQRNGRDQVPKMFIQKAYRPGSLKAAFAAVREFKRNR